MRQVIQSLKMHRLSRFVVLIGLGILVPSLVPMGFSQETIYAQGSIPWSRPERISAPNQVASMPSADVDNRDWVHVVWVVPSSTLVESTQGVGNLLVYARWDGQRWTVPVDVLIGPGKDVSFPSLTVDPYGVLHLMWLSEGKIYYSQSPSEIANSARAWSKPVSVSRDSTAGMFPVHLQSDSQGALHAVFSESSRSIRYMQSTDSGKSWSDMGLLVDLSDDYLAEPRLLVDQSGHLHVTWTQYNPPAGWPASGVFYSRSLNNGKNWSPPMAMALGQQGKAVMIERQPNELHVVWSGTEQLNGRYARYSMDGGYTWSSKMKIDGITATFGSTLQGLAVDSAQNLFLVAGIETVMSARWYKQSWIVDSAVLSPPKPADYKLNECTSMDLLSMSGNKLVAVYACVNDFPKVSAVWMNRLTTEAPSVAARKLLSKPTLTLIPTASSSPSTVLTTRVATPRPSQVPVNPGSEEDYSGDLNHTGFLAPLMLAAIPALLILVVVLMARVISHPIG